jgi:hypothetical protein
MEREAGEEDRPSEKGRKAPPGPGYAIPPSVLVGVTR